MLRVIHPNRWFIWTLILILAVSLVLMFFIQKALLQTEDEAGEIVGPPAESVNDPSIVGWRTFESELTGLSVKYPPEWQIEIEPSDPATFTIENPASFSEAVRFTQISPGTLPVVRESLSESELVMTEVDGRQAEWFKSQNENDPVLANVVLVSEASRVYMISGQAVLFEKILSGIQISE